MLIKVNGEVIGSVERVGQEYYGYLGDTYIGTFDDWEVAEEEVKKAHTRKTCRRAV